MSYLLINPPLTDPTAPYHSISYLVGATAARGYGGFSCLDANVDALNFLAREEAVQGLLLECADVRETLEAKSRLTRREELTYRYALKAVGLQPDSVRRAIDILNDGERFYDYPTYRQATLTLTRWIDVLSVRGFPGQFCGFNVDTRGAGNLANVADLANPAFLATFRAPFAPYFDEPFTQLLRSRPWQFVGLSVNYTSQLPFALLMGKLIRTLQPDCVLCAGGTEVSDDVKCLDDPGKIWQMFSGCDVLVVGEAEAALVDILDCIAAATPLPAGRPGILLPPGADPRTEDSERRPLVRYEDLATAPSPRYDVWDWAAYWSPEPIILYSPTRGCYWNKCTFCDYGLNDDGPTSPARVKPIEDCIRELRDISSIGRTLYLSVDAISPVYLRKLARAIVEAGLVIRWSAELRLERSLLNGLAQELRDAGCVAISFGYESGSQRVLDLINKGVKLEQVPSLLRELDRVGIGVQMMGFLGFPGETAEEAAQTLDFLEEHSDYWTIAGIGDFVLTPGAIVAKSPSEFGITTTSGFRGDDIRRFLYWVHGDDDTVRVPSITSGTETRPRLADLVRFPDDRPFVGGIDSSHTILYFARYGTGLVPPAARSQPASEIILATRQYRSPIGNVGALTRTADLIAFHRAARLDGGSADFSMVSAWLDQYPEREGSGEAGSVLDIFPNGEYVVLSAEEAAVEATAGPGFHLLRDLLLREVGAA